MTIPYTTKNENLTAHLQDLADDPNQPIDQWIVDHQLLILGHGTRGKYQHGCRCEQCKRANQFYKRDWSRVRSGFVAAVQEDRL